jgi:TonB family protein
MSTLSKETTEALSSTVSESAASPTSAPPQQSSGQLHSDAVSLEVALKVHGSKVTEVVRGVTPHTEPFEEQTSSMIVFPHGGVLRMSTSVSAGQMLVLTNLKSRQDAICRVVKVRTYSNSSSYVEVEFTHRQPGFWGVYFESDSIAAATPAVTPAPTHENSPKALRQTGPDVAAPKSPGLDKNESTFIGLGSQEDVQPAASLTSGAPSVSNARKTVQESKISQKPPTIVKQPSVVGIQGVPSNASISSPAPRTQQDEEDASVASEPFQTPKINDLPLGDLRAARTLAAEASASGRIDPTTQDAQGSEGKKNWLLIAACAGALLLAGAGAVLLSHHKSADSPAPQAHVQPSPASTQGVQVPPAQMTPPVSKPSPGPQASVRSTPAASVKAPKETVAFTEPPAGPELSASTASGKKLVPSAFGALNSHPVLSRQQTNGIAAPSVDAIAPLSADALAGITSSATPSAPPGSSSLRVSAPVQIGNPAKEPRLLVRVIPLYPPVAKQTHTEGDVVLDIAIDKSGSVTDAKVISGPTVLRMAAIGAVRRWKYEPLDGQQASAKVTVTIQFRL